MRDSASMSSVPAYHFNNPTISVGPVPRAVGRPSSSRSARQSFGHGRRLSSFARTAMTTHRMSVSAASSTTSDNFTKERAAANSANVIPRMPPTTRVPISARVSSDSAKIRTLKRSIGSKSARNPATVNNVGSGDRTSRIEVTRSDSPAVVTAGNSCRVSSREFGRAMKQTPQRHHVKRQDTGASLALGGSATKKVKSTRRVILKKKRKGGKVKVIQCKTY